MLIKENVEEIIHKAFEDYFGNKTSSAFHKYYSETVSNRDLFLSDLKFFRKFKQQYSLQGVDGNYLDYLEENKQRVLELVTNDDIATLYFEFFAKAKIQHGDTVKEKKLGSFFAKFVHTFSPEKYSALDNPIKEYFGLAKESFYISFFVISEAYKEWATENPEIINMIRAEAGNHSKQKMTDLKLLDLIFWYIANRGNKKK